MEVQVAIKKIVWRSCNVNYKKMIYHKPKLEFTESLKGLCDTMKNVYKAKNFQHNAWLLANCFFNPNRIFTVQSISNL